MTIREFFNHKNIWQSPITSVAGILILAMVGRKYWISQTLDANDIVLIGVAKGLLFAKDPNKVNPPSAPNAIMMSLMAMFLLSSCVTQRACLDKFGADTVKLVVHDTIPVTTESPVPADSLEGQIPQDTLSMLLDGKIDSLTDISESQKLSIKFWRDHYTSSLRYKADVKPDTIKITTEVPVEVECDCPPVVVVKPTQVARWYVRAWKGFQIFSGYLVLAEVVLLLVVVCMMWIRNRFMS